MGRAAEEGWRLDTVSLELREPGRGWRRAEAGPAFRRRTSWGVWERDASKAKRRASLVSGLYLGCPGRILRSPQQGGWSEGPRSWEARPPRTDVDQRGRWPRRRAPGKVSGTTGVNPCAPSPRPVRPGRAGPTGGWVPAFLPISPASSPAPTWAEQREGVRGRGRGGVCRAWGGVQAGRPRPRAPSRRGAAPSSIFFATCAGIWGTATYTAEDTEGTGRPHPPRHSGRHRVGPPSRSLAWGRNPERSGNRGGVKESWGLGAEPGGGVGGSDAAAGRFYKGV